jgi:gliding motility-associated protein GldM
MSGGKETPRQKMIGMMYLVLTALLALNVSKEILNAFVIVENGLNKTNENFDGKNGVLYAKFDKAMADNKAKTEAWYKKAVDVKKQANELCKMVDDIKSDLYLKVQGLPSKQVADTFKLTRLDSKDNFDIPTHYLLGGTPEEPGADAKVIPLKEAIIKFKKDIVATPAGITPEQAKKYAKEVASIKLGLNTDDVYSSNDEKKVHWEYNNFDHTTMAADMCIFAGIKNDIKNAESDVVGGLLKAITADDFSFDAVEAKVVANANYINAGEDYTADIFVSAHSSTQNPTIKISNGPDVPVTQGVGKYVVKTGAEGDQEYSGTINVKAPDGSVKPYPFSGKYTVAKPSMAVSPTKMNVFYIGVDNPVDISVAGVAPKDVSASMTGGSGTITPLGGGHFTVKVKSGDSKGNISVNVSKKTKDGSKSAGPPMVFRVKKVPSPQASYGGIVGDGKISKGELLSAGGVIPKLEDFVFDLKFPVISWNMSLFINGAYADYTAQGASATGAMKELLTKVKPGQKVLIEEVKVQAPDGVRKITGCVLKIK